MAKKSKKPDAPESAPKPSEEASEQPATDQSNEPAAGDQSIAESKKPHLEKFKQIVTSKRFRIIAPIVLLVIVLLIALIEPTRYAVMNLFAKGSAEFTVVDDSAKMPIEKAKVSVGNQSGETNKEGKVTLSKLKFGKHSYTVSKDNYTSITANFKVKPGENNVGPIELHSNGVPVQVTALNKLTQEPLKNFKVTIENTDISAIANNSETAELKVPMDRIGEVSIVISADGFNDTKQVVNVSASDNQPIATNLTPSGKQYFLSNRTGKVGIFSANLDGTDVQEVIAGGAANDANAQFSVSPDGKYAVLISRRDNLKDGAGATIPALYSVNLEAKTIKRIDEGAPYMDLLGWVNDNQVAYTISYGTNNRDDDFKVKTANVQSGALDTVFTNNQYAGSYLFSDNSSNIYVNNYSRMNPGRFGLLRVNVSNKSVVQLLDKSVGDIRQTKPGSFSVFADNKWYEVSFPAGQIKDGQEPTGPVIYPKLSQDKQKTAWVENRDGKGTVIVADSNGSNQRAVTSGSNVNNIVRWYGNDYVIFASQNNNESAQYIVNVQTGTVTKIADVYRNGYFR